MKILSAEQIKEADNAAIANEPVTSIDLMERAATACCKHINDLFTKDIKHIHVICGKGNNGGDGLAIARLIKSNVNEKKIHAEINVFILEYTEKASENYLINLERLNAIPGIKVIHIEDKNTNRLAESISADKAESIIIDAIFGSGLNKPVEGLCAEVIKIVNQSAIPVIAIDLPSGLFADTKTEKSNPVINAALTLTFQFPKLAFMFAENYSRCGDFVVLDIGLDKRFINNTDSHNIYLDKNEVAPLVLHRKKFSHKGSFGHALLIAGSSGKIGAAVFAARACLRSGAGLLTTHLPSGGVNIMQTAFPEAMVSADSEERFISELPKLENISAVGIGPGIGTDEQTAKVLKVLIQNFDVPMVIDADALNILSENKTWLGFLKPQTILTPHPKEFDRIAGTHTSDFDRLESAKELAFRNNVIIILKGAHTAIVTPGKKVFFNSTGNAGMAKGGSGDVLTGILTGLLARGYSPIHAAMIGVYLHGLAADIAHEKIHEESLLATDIIENISEGFKLLTQG